MSRKSITPLANRQVEVVLWGAAPEAVVGVDVLDAVGEFQVYLLTSKRYICIGSSGLMPALRMAMST